MKQENLYDIRLFLDHKTGKNEQFVIEKSVQNKFSMTQASDPPKNERLRHIENRILEKLYDKNSSPPRIG